MSLRRLFSLCTLVALLFAVGSPQALAAWICEGRTCGASIWACCCDTQTNDQNCAQEQTPKAGMSGCEAGCGCVLTTQSVDAQHRDTAPAGLDYAPIWATLPPAPFAVSAPRSQVERLVEARGPPLASAPIRTASLRGPPVLTRPHIGC